jgi:hypothetical protein
MDFIEKVLHFTPDGGSGMTELALFIAAVVATGVVIWRQGRSTRKR